MTNKTDTFGNIFDSNDNENNVQSVYNRILDGDVEKFINTTQTSSSEHKAFDPSYLGFKLFFDWYNSPLFKGGLSDNNEDNTNYPIDSALGYLSRIGETMKVKYLKSFINELKNINLNKPWTWQNIEGLDSIWTSYSNYNVNFFGGNDAKITISALETIGVPINGLINLYRAVSHDPKYDRLMLPSNLRKFSMYIYVYDIRQFHSKYDMINDQDKYLVDANDDIRKNSIAKTFQGFIPYSIYLGGCVFMPIESGGFLGDVSNISPEPTTAKIVIKYNDLKITNNLPWFDYVVNDSIYYGRESELKNKNNDRQKFHNYGRLNKTKSPERKKYIIDSSKVDSISENSLTLKEQMLAKMNRLKRNAVNAAKQAANEATDISGMALGFVKDNLGINNVYGKLDNVLNAEYVLNKGTNILYDKMHTLINDATDKASEKLQENVFKEKPKNNTKSNLGRIY